jgi:hypothetical protein
LRLTTQQKAMHRSAFRHAQPMTEAARRYAKRVTAGQLVSGLISGTLK